MFHAASQTIDKKDVRRCQDRISCLADKDIISLLDTFQEPEGDAFKESVFRLGIGHLDKAALVKSLSLLLGESDILEGEIEDHSDDLFEEPFLIDDVLSSGDRKRLYSDHI